MTTEPEPPMDGVAIRLAAINARTSSDASLAVNGSVIYDGQQDTAPQRGQAAGDGALRLPMAEDAGRGARRDEAGPPDDVLLTAVPGRSEAALKSLYERYADLVYTVALRIVGDRDLAQEVLQDVFFRCWQRAETFKPERGHLGGWLIGIARNRAVDLLRGSQHRARLRELGSWALDGAEDKHSQTDPLDQLALRQVMKTALEALPAVQRQAIELAFYGGFTQAEIAEAMATPLGTVKTRIRDGMQRLRGLLRPVLDQQHEVTSSPIKERGEVHD